MSGDFNEFKANGFSFKLLSETKTTRLWSVTNGAGTTWTERHRKYRCVGGPADGKVLTYPEIFREGREHYWSYYCRGHSIPRVWLWIIP